MKKILTTLAIGSSLYGATLEHYQLYKDIHTLRMGGANVGVGGSGTAIFYNPAGLSTLNREAGVELKLVNLSVTANENIIDLGQDSLNISDIEDQDEQNLEVLRLARENLGNNNHFELSNFSYVAKGVNSAVFSLGVLGNMNLDFRTHRGFGTNGFFDIQGLVVGGPAFGLSYDINEQLAIGVGAKYLQYFSVDHRFTIGELVSQKDDLETYLEDEVAVDGTSTVFDIGALYKFKNGSQVGVSGLNIGGIGEPNHQTYIPETYNIGFGYQKKFEFALLKKLEIGLDYMDLSDEYVESDLMKKVKSGLDLTFYDSTFFTLKSGVGMYQGYYTAGIDIRLALLEVSFTTYGEEIGAYSGQEEDRRYLLNIALGW